MLDNFGRKVIVPKIVPKDWAPGWNKNRRKCRQCQFRGLSQGAWSKNRCDYIEHERHSRGCKVEDCFRFIKGKRLKLNTRCHDADEEEEYAD